MTIPEKEYTFLVINQSLNQKVTKSFVSKNFRTQVRRTSSSSTSSAWACSTSCRIPSSHSSWNFSQNSKTFWSEPLRLWSKPDLILKVTPDFCQNFSALSLNSFTSSSTRSGFLRSLFQSLSIGIRYCNVLCCTFLLFSLFIFVSNLFPLHYLIIANLLVNCLCLLFTL